MTKKKNKRNRSLVDIYIYIYLGRQPTEFAGDLHVREPVKHGREQQRPHMEDDPDTDRNAADGMEPEVVAPPPVEERSERLHLRQVVPTSVAHCPEQQP